MKAYISKNGTLVIMPENQTEQFALQTWQERSEIAMSLDNHNERTLIRGSAIEVKP